MPPVPCKEFEPPSPPPPPSPAPAPPAPPKAPSIMAALAASSPISAWVAGVESYLVHHLIVSVSLLIAILGMGLACCHSYDALVALLGRFPMGVDKGVDTMPSDLEQGG